MKRLALVSALAVAAVIGLVVFGGFRLKDPQGNIAFGWDADARRFQIMEKPMLAAEGPHVFLHDGGYEVLATQQEADAWRLVRTQLPASPLPTLTVQVGNAAKTRFQVTLRPASPARSAVHPDNPPRLLMLSDIEGGFDRFTSLLRAQGALRRRPCRAGRRLRRPRRRHDRGAVADLPAAGGSRCRRWTRPLRAGQP
ncbi:MAG: hypothetical protein DI562_14680 [Stenotrophomonas acidaminiphila]|nr:MAG: hypothetical protein DI562_14680 [Stenotrophomonas acidaminiphila]